MDEIYLDHAATTRPWPEVTAAVARAMGEAFGNASSLHRRGLAAARELADAVDAIRAAAGSEQWQVVFTSGGSEADTQAVLGSVPRGKRDTVITSTVEHAAIEGACARVAERGGRVELVAAGARGVVDVDELLARVDERAALVTLTEVASEIGMVQPVAAVARAVKQRAPRCRVHVDAVQGFAQAARVDYPPEVDMVSISAHKIHGPQGIGALLLRPGVRPRPLICGGDQQDGVRPGTLNLPGIVGFGVAARLLDDRRESGVARMAALTDRLVEQAAGASAGVRLLGDPARRAAGIAVLAVAGVTSEVLLHGLEARGVLASSASACHSSRREPPRALVDAGLRSGEGAVRFSLGLETTAAEVDAALSAFAECVAAVRAGRAGELAP